MSNQSEWRANLALICYISLIGGIFLGSIMIGFILFGMGVDYLDSPFPIALIATPVNETIILVVTLSFAGYKGVSTKGLGLKKASPRILAIVSALALPFYLLGIGISVGQQIVFGPDPLAEVITKAVLPRDSFQLVVMIALHLALVGPCEELAFRGFIQKGFENSFGKTNGLLIVSVLFGLGHSLNTLYSIFPTFVGGLVLGYVWQKTGGNTIASALIHGINNSISIALAYFLTV